MVGEAKRNSEKKKRVESDEMETSRSFYLKGYGEGDRLRAISMRSGSGAGV